MLRGIITGKVVEGSTIGNCSSRWLLVAVRVAQILSCERVNATSQPSAVLRRTLSTPIFIASCCTFPCANRRTPAGLGAACPSMSRAAGERYTGLEGLFDYELVWTPDALPLNQAGAAGGVASTSAADGTSQLTALTEQLGLRVESSRASMDIAISD